VLASLNHPNIVQIHGLEESDPSTGSGRGSVRALVMELVDGPTLADRIARGPIPVDEARTIAAQMAGALEAAHEHGIIHRDLKPANVKVRPDGTVKVLDFGLAKARQGADRAEQVSAMTLPGVILRTTSYMAPEQAKGQPVDRRADIWAFGCVLFEMLTGHRAFAGEPPWDVLVGIIEREPDWQILPGTPPGIRRLLRRCIEKDPRRRLDSAAVARIEIEEAAREPTPVVPSTGTRRGLAWRPMLWAATGAGAALLVTMMAAGRARSSRGTGAVGDHLVLRGRRA
jgi:eukaryotic-like serine/threonine-protein kinase